MIERIWSWDRPSCSASRIWVTPDSSVLPYGASEANRIWPGGTSVYSARRSAPMNQAVSNSRFGRSAATRQIQARSVIPAWARMNRALGNSPASSTVWRPSAGIPRPAWIRIGSRRSSAISASSRTAGWSSVNCSARGCSLIPLAPAASARRASSGAVPVSGLTRQNGISRPCELPAASITMSFAAG